MQLGRHLNANVNITKVWNVDGLATSVHRPHFSIFGAG